MRISNPAESGRRKATSFFPKLLAITYSPISEEHRREVNKRKGENTTTCQLQRITKYSWKEVIDRAEHRKEQDRCWDQASLPVVPVYKLMPSYSHCCTFSIT